MISFITHAIQFIFALVLLGYFCQFTGQAAIWLWRQARGYISRRLTRAAKSMEPKR